ALAVAKSGKDRLETELGRLVKDLERVTTDKAATEAKLAGELTAVRAELMTASTAIAALQSRLTALDGENQTLSIRVPELESRLTRAQAEREQLLLELDRLRGELVTVNQRAQTGTDLATKVEESLRQLQEVTTQRDDLQRRLGQDSANLKRLDAELTELRTRDSALADALATAESRLAIEHNRFQAANKLLEQARSQHHAVSTERDDTQVQLAQSEAQRQNLETQLNRMRAELSDLRTRRMSQGTTEQDAMNAHAIEDTSRIEALENELIDARMKLKGMEGGNADSRTAALIAERDRMARELAELRQHVDSLMHSATPATGDTAVSARLTNEQARARDLERRLAQAVAERETAATEAAMLHQKLQSVTQGHRRLEERMELQSADPSVALKELETTKRRLRRARRRLRVLEAERAGAVVDSASAATDAEDAEAQLEMLRRTSLTIGLGGSLPAHNQHDTVRTAPVGRIEGFTQFENAPQTQIRQLSGKTPSPFSGRIQGSDRSTQPFTSSHGRPAIAAPTTAPQSTTGTARYRVHPLTLKEARRQARRRMRLALTIGAPACAVALGMWWVVLPSMFPTTGLAGVNAKFMSVKAPIEGKLSTITRAIGDSLGREEVLTVIRNDKVDRSTLQSFKRRLTDSTARKIGIDSDVESLRTQRKALESQLLEQRTQLADYLVSRISEGARRLEAMDGDLAATRSVLNARSAAREPGSTLVDAAFTAAIEAEAIASKAIEVQRESLARLRTNLEALDAGVFADESITRLQHRIDSIETSLVATTATQSELTITIAKLADDAQAEERRVHALEEATISSPIDGRMIKRPAADDKWVKPNEELFAVAIPESIVVDAVVSRDQLQDIAVGDQVRIRLSGEHRVVDGKVRAVGEAYDRSANYAYSFPQGTASSARVSIVLDRPIADAVIIGQSARVMVTGDPGLIKGMFAWMYEKMKF
ncbi:MAG: HlyD family efflux transporter periplasmic adaptor subunit, partial [Planctomycetes bacterium]|nr:HlyD family efflux transporter periplasmic adaptor subunit [Planctomycetota bacterium]